MATLRLPTTGSVVTGTQQDDLLIIPSGFAHSSKFLAEAGSDSVSNSLLVNFLQLISMFNCKVVQINLLSAVLP